MINLAKLASGGGHEKLTMNSSRIIIKSKKIKLYGHFSLKLNKKYQNCGRKANSPKLNTIIKRMRNKENHTQYTKK